MVVVVVMSLRFEGSSSAIPLKEYRGLSSTQNTEHVKSVDTLVCMNMVKMQSFIATFTLQVPQGQNVKGQLYLSRIVKVALSSFISF